MIQLEDRHILVGPWRARYWENMAEHTGATKGFDHPAPVILLHGIGCSVQEWGPTLAATAARGRHTIALDMLGSGGSDKPLDASYSLRELARFVLDFMRIKGHEVAHLGGHSLGGRVALECARVAPARVASLTLAAPAGVGHESAINFRLATVPLLGELLTWPTRMGLRQLWRSAYAVPSRIEAERLEAKLADARAPGAQAAFLKTLRGFLALGGFPQDQVDALRDDLPSLRSPTLVVWGQQDHLLPVEHGRQLARAMPNAELLVLDDCGHLPQIEASERFNAALLNFLDTVDATSARLM